MEFVPFFKIIIIIIIPKLLEEFILEFKGNLNFKEESKQKRHFPKAGTAESRIQEV